jgi:hypothetical protein
MKKLIFLLMLLPTLALSQVRIEALQLNDSTANALTYAANGNDTSIAYDMRGYDAAWVEFSATDSVEVYINYTPSLDGSTFRAEIAMDSLISTVAAGNHVSFPVPSKAMGEHRVKFVLAFEAAGNGVTTPKYTARLIRKKYGGRD